jgi:hypothetical protein
VAIIETSFVDQQKSPAAAFKNIPPITFSAVLSSFPGF